MNNDDSDENNGENENSDGERIRHLLTANERLQAQLGTTQQQLASLSALSTSLMQHQQQAGDVLVAFGQGTAKRYLNARSVRMLSLQEGMVVEGPATHYSDGLSPSGTFAVLVDELQVTGYLEPRAAEQALDQWAEALNAAMQPL